MLSGWELALGLGAMFFGAVVLGSIGLGMGTVAMPFLLLILMPQDAVVIVNAMVILTTVLTVAQTWRQLRLGETWGFLAAGLPPVPIAALLLREFNPTALRLVIVVIILGLGLMNLFNIRMPGARKRWMAPLVGVSTTFMVTMFAVGAPLAAIYAIEQDWTGDEIRATLSLYFLLAAMVGMSLFLAAGMVGVTTAQNIGVLAIAVALGSAVAAVVANRIRLRVFRYVVVGITIAGSISLLAREAVLRL